MLRKLVSSRFLFFYAVLSIALPNVSLAFTEHMPFWACLANVVLPMGIYALLMSLSRKVGRQVWFMFPLIFFAAFQMVLLYLYGRSVIAVDMFLNLVTTNPGEALELLDNLVPAVAGVVVVYVPLLTLATVAICRKQCLQKTFLSTMRRLSLCAIVVGLLLVGICYTAYPRSEESAFQYRAEDHLYPLNVGYNLCLAFHESSLANSYQAKVAQWHFGARSSHPADSAEVYVLVIGETARAQNFQLYGYNRPTNPRLSKCQGLCVFQHVLSQSNTTHKSVPMLLSAASATDHSRLYEERSLISAFREAGFHTTFLSNQQPNHSFIDFFGAEAHDFVFIRDDVKSASTTSDAADEAHSDLNLLPYLERILAAHRQRELIVVHTYGSHFNYRDRYSRRDAFFMPDSPTEAKPSNRPSLVNAYDNSLRVTDRLLADIIAMLDKRGCQAAMLYTSDHGENIFDDHRERFLHASPVPSAHDIRVPLIVWTSTAYRQHYSPLVKAMHDNRLKDVESSRSVFPTMLSLAGITSPKIIDVMPFALTDKAYASPHHRHYLDDHNRAVTLRQVGLGEEDFEMLNKWGLAE